MITMKKIIMPVPDHSNYIQCAVQVKLAHEAPRKNGLDVVVSEVAEQEQVNAVRCENGPNGMIDALDPRGAGDIVAGMPHEGPTQEPADSHHRDVVAGAGLDNTAGARDEPKLWQHREYTNEEAGHPESVEDRTAVHICVEDSGKNKSSEDCWQRGERIGVPLVSLRLHHENVVQQTKYNHQRANVHELVNKIARRVHGEVPIEPCSG